MGSGSGRRSGLWAATVSDLHRSVLSFDGLPWRVDGRPCKTPGAAVKSAFRALRSKALLAVTQLEKQWRNAK